MRGTSYCHRTMIETIACLAAQRGAEVKLEHAVPIGLAHGFVDVFIRLGGLRIAVEAEQSARRVGNDVRKAAALRATHLLIVTPTARVARTCASELARHPHSGVEITVCTLGTALHLLPKLFTAAAPAAEPKTSTSQLK